MLIWYSLLLVSGFKPNYAKLEIIDKMVNLYDLELYNLDLNDIKSLSFDLRDYN